jgi:hypothetical protein
MSLEFLTYQKYEETAQAILRYHNNVHQRSNWKTYRKRWDYHALTIEIIRRSGVENPGDILEMGTAGVQLVSGSHTLDYDEQWHFPGFNPTYLHDARKLPWPIKDKQYKWLIALRVFHHLHPVQRRCFEEAARIADNLIIVVPAPAAERPSKGISLAQFRDWNGGVPPALVTDVAPYGFLYHWSPATLAVPQKASFWPMRLFR